MTVETHISSHLSTAAQKYFERLYLDVRGKEQRIYTDAEVAALPYLSTSHPHHTEWQMRKHSAVRLVHYLGNKKKPLRILEVGCGNGWLSSMLADINKCTVTGSDINSQELEQATRVFRHKANLRFEYEDIRNLSGGHYDIIVFAASIQYFESFNEIIAAALRLLSANGEIHVMDSIFYTQAEVASAKQRSNAYYSQMGAKGMESMYFHHTVDDIAQYRHKVMFDPRSTWNRLLQKKDPFYWFVLYP